MRTHIKTGGGPYVEQNRGGWVVGAASHVRAMPDNPKPPDKEEKRKRVPERLTSWLAALAALVGLAAAAARGVGWM